MRRLLLPAIAFVLAPLMAAAPAHGFGVTGYVQAGVGHDAATIAAAASTVTDYGIDGAVLNADGATITVPQAVVDDLAAARATGKPSSLLLSNYDDAIQDFSPALASRMLDDAGRRAAVVEALRVQVATAGWNGITVDLESLDPNDRASLTAFVTELRAVLPAGTTLDIDVPAGTDPTDPYVQPFDLPALAAQVDHVSLMAYDQHYMGGAAGPIGGLPWFNTVARIVTAQIPAAELRVGVAGYGYRWKKGKPTGQVTVKQARRLAGKRAHWSKRQGEWQAKLKDGSTMWWSDRRSVALRTAIAAGIGADGIAVWRLGAADPLQGLAAQAF